MSESVSRRTVLTFIGSTLAFGNGCRLAGRRFQSVPDPSGVPWHGFDAASYNALPLVESASESLTAIANWFDLIRQGLRIVADFGLCDDLGIFLLHRHWKVADSELILERKRYDQARQLVYASSRNPIDSLWNERIAPWRFSVLTEAQGLAYKPIEFSSDPAVSRSLNRVARNRRFQQTFANFLTTNRLTNLLGLSINARDRGLRIGKTGFLEESDILRQESVVRIVAGDEMQRDSTIPTTWMCTDASGCCTPQAYCISSCTGTDDGHLPWHTSKGGHVGCV